MSDVFGFVDSWVLGFDFADDAADKQ